MKKKGKGEAILENNFQLQSSLSKSPKMEWSSSTWTFSEISNTLNINLGAMEKSRTHSNVSHTKVILSRPFFSSLFWAWCAIYGFRDCTTLKRIRDLLEQNSSEHSLWLVTQLERKKKTKYDESEKISFSLCFLSDFFPITLRTHLGFNKTNHKQQHISSEIYSE